MSDTVQAIREVDRRELLRRMLGFAQHHHARLTAKASALGLTSMQAKALYFIAEIPSTGKLAMRLHCDASNLTGIVKRLEDLGYIERRPDPTDRRVKRFEITEKGWQVRREVEAAMFGVPELDALSDQQISELGELMKIIWREVDPAAD